MTRPAKQQITAAQMRVSRLYDAKEACEREYLRATYAAEFDSISPNHAASAIETARAKMIEARREYDAAKNEYQGMINHE